MAKIKRGQRVWIKPEYRDAGDEGFEWYAVEDEDGGRVSIHAEPNPLGPNAVAHPWTVVRVECLSVTPN
jgi:hypothetical protein